MTERPIIFSAPMVRAILEGRKSRRKLYVKKGEDPSSPEHWARRLANGLNSAEPGECWEWQRTHNGQGYGAMRVAGKMVYAHRLAFELAGNVIPNGMHVLHKCDNPRCIHPEHLEIGTASKNMADCRARGRSRIPSPRMKGEANGSAKLTSHQVSEIRRLLAGGHVQRKIAKHFGISQTMVSRIKLGKA